MAQYIFDEEYDGERFKYGLQYRPFDLGTVPKGHIIGSLRENENKEPHRFGTIEYPFELTERQVASFQLIDLNEDSSHGTN